MCQFKSGLILKNKTICPLDHDNHEEMIKKAGLKDNGYSPKFVRVEIHPIDGNIFNHDLKNWKLIVDQDYRPDWFEEKWTEEEMKKELQILFKERFIIDDKTWQKREGQRIFVKNSSVVAWENSSVVARENSSVVAWENSSVVAWENSSVVARENSQILLPTASWYSQNTKIKGVYDLASIKDLKNNKIIVASKELKKVIWKK